jgi:hypothetical protein
MDPLGTNYNTGEIALIGISVFSLALLPPLQKIPWWVRFIVLAVIFWAIITFSNIDWWIITIAAVGLILMGGAADFYANGKHIIMWGDRKSFELLKMIGMEKEEKEEKKNTGTLSSLKSSDIKLTAEGDKELLKEFEELDSTRRKAERVEAVRNAQLAKKELEAAEDTFNKLPADASAQTIKDKNKLLKIAMDEYNKKFNELKQLGERQEIIPKSHTQNPNPKNGKDGKQQQQQQQQRGNNQQQQQQMGNNQQQQQQQQKGNNQQRGPQMASVNEIKRSGPK